MKHATITRLAFLASALLPAAGQANPQLDQLLEQTAPILAEPEAYHTPEDTGETLEPLALTLDQCVALALQNNARILEADTEVALREAQTGQAKARRRPQIQGQYSYNYIDNLDQGIGSPLIQGLIGAEGYAPEKATTTTGLSINQLIYAGGQVQAAVKASQYLASSEAWRRDAVRAEIAFQAREAYHTALLASSLVTVAEEALEAFERHVSDTEILQREGASTAYEVLRAKTEAGARRSDLEAARAGAKLADINMRRILALPENQPLTYDAALPWTPVGEKVEALVAAARAQRPEVLALQEAVAASDHQERGVKGKYLPQAAATVRWQSVDNGGQVMTDGWSVNVGAQWDLYLGGQRKHELGEVRARAEGLRIQLADMERLVAADVEQACVRLDETTASMRTGKETVVLAAESVRLANLRFKEGVGTQTEIIDTELTLTQAKTGLVQAIRDYFVAYAALQRAAGGDPAASSVGAVEETTADPAVVEAPVVEAPVVEEAAVETPK
jgi:outer membrane protein TolC